MKWYTAISSLDEKGQPLDIISVLHELGPDKLQAGKRKGDWQSGK